MTSWWEEWPTESKRKNGGIAAKVNIILHFVAVDWKEGEGEDSYFSLGNGG